MLDLENAGLAVRISFLSHLEADIITRSISDVAILGFLLPVSSCSSPTSAIDMPKNVRVAAAILYLASIEAKIHWFMCRTL